MWEFLVMNSNDYPIIVFTVCEKIIFNDCYEKNIEHINKIICIALLIQ